METFEIFLEVTVAIGALGYLCFCAGHKYGRKAGRRESQYEVNIASEYHESVLHLVCETFKRDILEIQDRALQRAEQIKEKYERAWH